MEAAPNSNRSSTGISAELAALFARRQRLEAQRAQAADAAEEVERADAGEGSAWAERMRSAADEWVDRLSAVEDEALACPSHTIADVIAKLRELVGAVDDRDLINAVTADLERLAGERAP